METDGNGCKRTVTDANGLGVESSRRPNFLNDKAYDLGCSNKRPDMVCDLGSHILIIECDENIDLSNKFLEYYENIEELEKIINK